jgi:hypothetical protein
MLAAITTLAATEPPAQQVTWLYSPSLSRGAAFLGALGLAEVNGTRQAGLCRIFHTDDKASSFLGVCDTRPAPICPNGPEGAGAPPITYTLVVRTRADVNSWHKRLVAVGGDVVRTTLPEASARFAVYSFNVRVAS